MASCLETLGGASSAPWQVAETARNWHYYSQTGIDIKSTCFTATSLLSIFPSPLPAFRA